METCVWSYDTVEKKSNRLSSDNTPDTSTLPSNPCSRSTLSRDTMKCAMIKTAGTPTETLCGIELCNVASSV